MDFRTSRFLTIGLLLVEVCTGRGESPEVLDADAPAVPEISECEPAGAAGPLRDLVAFARLRASKTVADGLWVREAEHAVATIRDDFPDTGWWPPANEQAVIEVDFEPLLGRAVRVDQTIMEWTGEAPSAVSVEWLQACGGTVQGSVPWVDLSRPLEIGAQPAGCVQVRLTGAATTRITGLQVLSRDPCIPAPREGPDASRPPRSFPGYGVIEGFYGRPWSWQERERILAVLANHGLTAYLYAPKDDPLHRHRWREPYPAPDMDRFEALATQAARLGVALVFGISPFLDFDFSSEDDYLTLLAKARTFLDRGFPGIGILADDIEFETAVTMDAALGQRHAALVNRLVADLRTSRPDVQVWFTPTVYSDERLDDNPGGPDYLKALAALDPEVVVLWTGPATSSATMKAADLARVTALIARKPLIWDNFWANDGGDLLFGRLLASPFTGRGPDLPAAVLGIAHNPSIQGSLDRVLLAMFGRWVQDPTHADRADQIAHAIESERLFLATGDPTSAEHSLATLRLVLEVFEGHAVSTPAYHAMEEAVDSLRNAVAGSGLAVEPAWNALHVFAGMAALASDLWHSSLDVDLVDDLVFAVEAPRWQGEQGLWSLALLGARWSGRQGAEFEALAEAASEQARTVRFVLSPGTVQSLSDAIAALPVEDRGFSAPVVSEEPPPCEPGRPWSFQVFSTGADRIEVYGLPGASVHGTTVAWIPPHAGRYRGVAIARSDIGWGFRLIDCVCESP